MKMKKGLLGVLVVMLAAVMITSCAREAKRIQLQLNLKGEETYNLWMTSKQKISQTIQGQKQDMVQTIGMGYIYNVQGVDAEGIATVKCTYHSILFRLTGPMGTIEYDSFNPPEVIHPMAMSFASFEGQSFLMMMSPDGRVKDVRGIDAMLTNMMEKLDMPEGPMKVATEKNLREQFDEKSLKEAMENMTAIYPEESVAIGDSWKKRVVISKGFPVILDNTFTLKSIRDDVVILGIISKATPNLEADPIKMGPAKLRYDISGIQKGTVELDKNTGWIIRGKATQKFSGEVKIEGDPQMPEGISWPISVDTVITMEPFRR